MLWKVLKITILTLRAIFGCQLTTVRVQAKHYTIVLINNISHKIDVRVIGR